jgi:hypothetical protein
MPDSSSACADCLNAILNEPSGDCSSFNVAVCDGLMTCGCDPCQASLEAFYSCMRPGCTVDCTGSPPSLSPSLTEPVSMSPTTVPTTTNAPSPDSLLTCSSESVVYLNCLNETLTESGIDECKTCLSASFAASNATACGEIQTAACESVSFCPCEGCSSVIEDYLGCVYEASINCPLQCSNETEQMSCTNEWRAYSSCLYSDLSGNDSASCRTCVSSSQGSTVVQSTDCSGVQTQACGPLANCSECGSCSDVAQQWLTCQLIYQTRDTCDISCGTSPESTPSPLSAPTPAPELNSGNSSNISANSNESNDETQTTSWSRPHYSASYQCTIVSTLAWLSLVFRSVV